MTPRTTQVLLSLLVLGVGILIWEVWAGRRDAAALAIAEYCRTDVQRVKPNLQRFTFQVCMMRNKQPNYEQWADRFDLPQIWQH